MNVEVELNTKVDVESNFEANADLEIKVEPPQEIELTLGNNVEEKIIIEVEEGGVTDQQVSKDDLKFTICKSKYFNFLLW